MKMPHVFDVMCFYLFLFEVSSVKMRLSLCLHTGRM